MGSVLFLVVFVLSLPLLIFIFFLFRLFLRHLALHLRGLRHLPRPSSGAFSLVSNIYRSTPERTATWLNTCAPPSTPLIYVNGPFLFSNVIILSPAAVRAVSRSPYFPRSDSVVEIVSSFTGPGSIISSEGPRHHRLRKTYAPSLSHENVVSHLSSSFFAQADALADRFCNLSGEETATTGILGSGIDPLPIVRIGTFNVIADACFGQAILPDKQRHELFDLYNTAFDMSPLLLFSRIALTGFPFEIPYHVVSKSEAAKRSLKKIVRSLCERLLKQREVKEKSVENSLLWHIASTSEDDVSVDELTTTLLAFLFAGQATTNIAVCWVLYTLGKNVKWQEKLFVELRDVPKGDLQLLDRCEILDAIVKEVLRLYPPVSTVMRKVAHPTQRGVTVEGYFIPNDTIVRLPFTALHTDSHTWGNGADTFSPERWLEDKLDGGAVKDPYMWAPFWFGRNNCIGQRFAMLEMKAMIKSVVDRVKIYTKPDRDGVPRRWAIDTSPIGMKLYFEIRS